MSVVRQPEEPGVVVHPPDEALRRAQPLPLPDELVIQEVSDEEWDAFEAALADT